MKRVVITGMGIYSCIGKNLDEVKDSLYNGKSGIGIDPVRKELGYFSALTGILERPDLKKLLDRRKRLCLPEQGEYAYLATLEAFRNAGINEDFLEANEVGILYGNDSSAAPVINAVDIIREKKNTALVGSGSISVDEFHRDNEPVSYFQTKRGQLHHCRSLCKRFSRYWYGLPAYKIGITGLYSLRWRTRSQSLCSRKFRRTKRIFHPGSSPRESLETF